MAWIEVGQLIDAKYRLIRVIGEGGWGIVFEAENTRTLKHVALKVLRPQASLTSDIIARFEREAQAAGRIGSEHIVEVFDLGTLEDGTHYMVLELLSGEDLASRLKKLGKIDPVTTVKLAVQLLEGLGAAHSAGILHRDLKPENLYLVPTRSGEDFLKILDFGISKFSNGPAASATMTGAIMGSPCYMAPEQARGLKQVDWRTDLYSVGTVLFECVTGRVPFTGDNFNDLMFKIVLAPRPSPLDLCPDLDPDLAAIITKAISVEPDGRYATTAEFRDVLVAWLGNNGVYSVRGPELRGVKKTPMGAESPAALPRQPSVPEISIGEPAAAPWHDATVSVDAVASAAPSSTANETPIASSRAVSKAEHPRGGRAVLMGGVAGVVVALTIAGLVLPSVMRSHAEASPRSPVDPPAPAPTTANTAAAPEPAVIAPAAVVSAVEGATRPEADAAPVAVVASAAPDTPRSAAESASSAASRNGHRDRARAPGASATAGSAPPPRTAAPASAASHTDKVEGREIRDGL